MPNTLAHLGVAGLLTRLGIRDADLRWIYLGAIVPDIPWIMLRIMAFLGLVFDPTDLKRYFIAQASLFFCALLCLSISCFSSKRLQTFAMLLGGSLFHLLLDALQIKWANGVHLFAPFSWKLSRFDLFWPESLPTYILTGYGLIYVLWTSRKLLSLPLSLRRSSLKLKLLAILFLGSYTLLPFVWLEQIKLEDNHFLQTLEGKEERRGQAIAFDRIPYVYRDGKGYLLRSKNEPLQVSGLPLRENVTVSIRGHFVSEHSVAVADYHVHQPNFRDGASYVGLSLVAMLWGSALYQIFRNRRQ